MQITYSCFTRRPLTLSDGTLSSRSWLASKSGLSLLIWIVLCEPFPRGLNNASVQVVDKSRAVQLRPTRLCGPRDVRRFSARLSDSFGQFPKRLIRRGVAVRTRVGRNATVRAATRKIRMRPLLESAMQQIRALTYRQESGISICIANRQ